jgi:peroxiredoxin
MMWKTFLFAFAIIGLGLVSCSTKQKEPEQRKVLVNDMPTLPITLMDSTKLVIREQSGNVILIFFLSDCEHCQREAESIKEKIEAFKNYTLYFISNERATSIKEFSDKCQLSNFPNVKFGKTELAMIISNFGAIPTPSMFIYSSDRKLVREFKGETKIEDIIAAL